jgi:hypothetical protein
MPSYKEILLKNKPKPTLAFESKNYLLKYVEPVLESKATVPEVLQTHSDWRTGKVYCQNGSYSQYTEMPFVECEDLQAELFVAVQTENINEINYLIQKGADVNKTIGWMEERDNSHYYTSFLHIAIEKLFGLGVENEIYTFKKINKTMSVAYGSKSSFKNRFQVIQCLIQNGANTDYIIPSYTHAFATLLQSILTKLSRSYSGRQSNSFELCFRVLHLLLKNGANPNTHGRFTWKIPIYEVFRIFNQNEENKKVNEHCFQSKVDIVHLLLFYGSEIPFFSEKILKKEANTQTKRLYKYIQTWPSLCLTYCLVKKKMFVIF